MNLFNHSEPFQVENEEKTDDKFHFLERNPPTEKGKSALKRCRQCTKTSVHKNISEQKPQCTKKQDIIVQFVLAF